MVLLACACSGRNNVTEDNFVGKWRSSKLETPLHLYKNGEWEIKKDDGAVLQYGIWQYRNQQIIWTFKMGPNVGHEANAVLLATPDKFQVREMDQSVTTFSKLD
jgi:hypothetical protein